MEGFAKNPELHHSIIPPLQYSSLSIGVFTKDITAALLAIVFVLYSLIALVSVERNQDSTSSPLVSNQERVSELGLRVAFQR